MFCMKKLVGRGERSKMARKVTNPKLMEMVQDALKAYDRPMTFHEIKSVLEDRYDKRMMEGLLEDLVITLRIDMVKANLVRLSKSGSVIMYEAVKEAKNKTTKKAIKPIAAPKPVCQKCGGVGSMVYGKPGSRGLKHVPCPDCKGGWLKAPSK